MKATEILEQQHREVEKLFKRALRSDDPEGWRELCDEITYALQLHTSLEEEIFYPAFRQEADTRKAEKMVLEAYEEHHVVDLVLSELPELDPGAESFEARLTVLQELVDQHVDEEEAQMFPAAERAFGNERSQDLAEQMQSRISSDDEGDDDEDRAERDDEVDERDELR